MDERTPDSPEPVPRLPKEEWFRRAFGEDYLMLYAHRDAAEARRLIRTLSAGYDLSGRVLDLGCGAGRFLRALADSGQTPLGLDLSRPLLRSARLLLGREPPPLILADMRQLPVRAASLGWVLLLFTSFGYFKEEEEDRSVLREIARSLADGGHLVLDFFNPARTIRELVPESRRRSGGWKVKESRWVDAEGPFLRKRIEVRGESKGESATIYQERVRIYRPDALRDLMRSAGLEVETMLGDYEGSAFVEETSNRCILIGRKG